LDYESSLIRAFPSAPDSPQNAADGFRPADRFLLVCDEDIRRIFHVGIEAQADVLFIRTMAADPKQLMEQG
jgi:hypothetical protein